MTSRVLAGTLRGAIKRLGEPVIRARRRPRDEARWGASSFWARRSPRRWTGPGAARGKGYTYSAIDMLGEAAMHRRRCNALSARLCRRLSGRPSPQCAGSCHAAGGSVHTNPGISIKLSALHPRYEVAQGRPA